VNTREVAKKLIRYCRDQQHQKAVQELYADNCISREIAGADGELVKGKAAIIEKNNKWFEMVEIFHECEVSDPLIAGNFFSCKMLIDVSFHGNNRMQLEEIGVYEVKDGLIISEQFFYCPPT
jgi:hypothetical protein